MTRSAFLPLCLATLLAPTLQAQGNSPIEVTRVSVSPSPFKAGDEVTVTVTYRNRASAPYGCDAFEGFFYAFKGTAHLSANLLWNVRQSLGSPMAAGETRTLACSTRFRVPTLDAPALMFVAWSPACPPDEFGHMASLACKRRADGAWVAPATLRFERKPLKALPLLKR